MRNRIITQQEIDEASHHYNISTGNLRSLMEAVKQYCGWSEGAALCADSDEMWKALHDRMPK